MLKPYPFTTQCPHHHSPLPFPFSSKPNLSSSIFLPNPLSPTTHHHQPIILCASKNPSQSQPSNRRILQLASIIALNLKILPEPFNFLAAEIARGHWTPNLPEPSSILNSLGGARAKKKRKTNRERRTNLAWFVLVPICCLAGFWSWRVSELDVLVKALLFGLVGVSLIRLRLGKKAIEELILGFLIGVFFMVSCGLRKEDLKFWVGRLRVCSPAALIVNRNRNRNWKRNWRMSK